jgi:DNA polymerase-4
MLRSPVSRVVLHADMDAFFASVEQRDHPELRGRPVIVGGAGGRGVVAAASYEARPFGVRSAMPTAEALRLCPQAIVVPGDLGKYRRISRQLRALFEELSPVVEPIALDEACIDITASLTLLGTPLDIGRRLRARVRAETGLAVSVGIAPTRMVAKIASDVAKPDGLCEVRPDEVASFLAPLGVERLRGVGPVTRAALVRRGLATIADLLACPPAVLARHVGRSAADVLSRLARGEDARLVEPDRAARSIGEEHTFATDVAADAPVRAAIVAHADAVAARLRQSALRARVVVLKMKLDERLGPGKYRLLTRRTTLTQPTDDGHAIATEALALWQRHRPARPIRLVGVAAAGLDGASQLGLFTDPATLRRRALNAALDAIVARFGAGSVRRGGAVIEKALSGHVPKERQQER